MILFECVVHFLRIERQRKEKDDNEGGESEDGGGEVGSAHG